MSQHDEHGQKEADEAKADLSGDVGKTMELKPYHFLWPLLVGPLLPLLGRIVEWLTGGQPNALMMFGLDAMAILPFGVNAWLAYRSRMSVAGWIAMLLLVSPVQLMAMAFGCALVAY